MTVPPMVREEGVSRYRIGDYTIHRETWRIWRVWWTPMDQVRRVRAGLSLEGFPTLREARAHVEDEIANDAEAAAMHTQATTPPGETS